MATEPIIFKTEDSLWNMMAEVNPDGRSAKPFDMRRWDLSDARIRRISLVGGARRSGALWGPEIKQVSFLNKTTGALLTFEYLGVEFAGWAPGWGFLKLGKRLYPAGAVK